MKIEDSIMIKIQSYLNEGNRWIEYSKILTGQNKVKLTVIYVGATLLPSEIYYIKEIVTKYRTIIELENKPKVTGVLGRINITINKLINTHYEEQE